MTFDSLLGDAGPGFHPAATALIPLFAGLWFLHRRLTRPAGGDPRGTADQSLLFLAEGFGAGRLRPGPGTWGSLLGIAWFLLLLATAHPLWITILVAISALAAVPVCAAAERITGRHDPGSVVLDEIVAVPLAFLPWLWTLVVRDQPMPATGDFLTGSGLARLVLGFALFRLLDIWKPWPIRPSQRLPGGWGVVVDDLLAGVLAGVLGLLWR